MDAKSRSGPIMHFSDKTVWMHIEACTFLIEMPGSYLSEIIKKYQNKAQELYVEHLKAR